MKFPVRRQGNTLVPWSGEGVRLLEGMHFNKTYDADITQKRNGNAHRLYWKTSALLAEALNDAPGSTEWTQVMVSDRLKLATGRADTILLSASLAKHYGGTTGLQAIGLKPQSISFANMDQTEFSEFLTSCMRYVRYEFGEVLQDHPSFAEVNRIVSPVIT